MDCPAWIKYSGMMFHVICMFPAFIAVFFLYKFCKYSKNNNLPKCSFIVSSSFYLFTAASLFGAATHGLNACLFNVPFTEWKAENKIYYILFACCYFLQYHLMLIVLFQRLYITFNESFYALNKKHASVIIIIHILFLLSIIVSMMNTRYWILCNIVYVLLLIGLVFWITFLFISRLFVVFTNVYGDETDALLPLIIKITLLACLSVSVSVISQTLFTITVITSKQQFFTSYFLLIDVFNNVICVSLMFKFGDKYYNRYCKFADRCCKSICKQAISIQHSNRNHEMMEIEMQSIQNTDHI
eukprot:471360_1